MLQPEKKKSIIRSIKDFIDELSKNHDVIGKFIGYMIMLGFLIGSLIFSIFLGNFLLIGSMFIGTLISTLIKYISSF